MMIKPLNLFIKLSRSMNAGAAIGALVCGGTCFWFIRRIDPGFWAMVLLGSSAGGAIHTLIKHLIKPGEERRRLQTEVLEVAALRDTGFISKQKAQEIIDKLIETKFLGKRRSDSDW